MKLHALLNCDQSRLTHSRWSDYRTLPFMQSVSCWMVVRGQAPLSSQMTQYHYQDAIVHCLTFRPLPCTHWHLYPYYAIPSIRQLVREFSLEGGSTWGPTLCPDPVTLLSGGEQSGNTYRLNERGLWGIERERSQGYHRQGWVLNVHV